MTEPPTVLVPVEILTGEVVPDTLIEVLAPVPVVLLGYHEIPDQTPPAQARQQFGERAEELLADLAERLEAQGGTVETQVVFTADPDETIERVATDLDRVAVLLINPSPQIEQVLVAVRGGINVEAIGSMVAAIVEETAIAVTLYHATEDGTPDEEAIEAIEGIEARLEAAGVDPENLHRQVEETDEPLYGLIELANEHDLLVMGEDRPKITDKLFGETSERVADRSVVPVLVVRRPNT